MKVKIWLVDDDDIESLIVSSMLEHFEQVAFLQSFTNGAEAWQALAACTSDEWPDVILLDLYMPKMDGFEFLDLYMQTYADASVADVVILTSSSFKEDEEKARKYGCVKAFVRKSLVLTQLQKLLQQRFNLDSEHDPKCDPGP